MGEFELIRRFFAAAPVRRARLGIGDDCALLADCPAGECLAVSTDLLLAGRHFFDDVDPSSLGWKSLAVNLSDLAAMGAQPVGFTLALALPEADETVSHGMPCFGIVKGKKFAYFTQDHHGDGKTAILVKISGVDEQAMLIEADADRYYRPAYFGDGWIGIRLDLGDNDWAGIADWLRKSWIAIAPPKLRQGFAIADEF